MATPRKSAGEAPIFLAAGPSSQAPRPSIVTFDAVITIALVGFLGIENGVARDLEDVSGAKLGARGGCQQNC